MVLEFYKKGKVQVTLRCRTRELFLVVSGA